MRRSRSRHESARGIGPPAVQIFSAALEDGLRREFVYGGDLLVFKGVEPMAELCGVTRFSVEVRTVDARDAAGSRGAPNVDGAAPRIALDWFRCAVDGMPLSGVVL